MRSMTLDALAASYEGVERNGPASAPPAWPEVPASPLVKGSSAGGVPS